MAQPLVARKLRKPRKGRNDKQSQVKKTMNLPSRLLQLRRCHLGGGRKLQIPACSHHLLLLLLYRAISTFLQLMCKPLRRKSSAQPLPLLIQILIRLWRTHLLHFTQINLRGSGTDVVIRRLRILIIICRSFYILATALAGKSALYFLNQLRSSRLTLIRRLGGIRGCTTPISNVVCIHQLLRPRQPQRLLYLSCFRVLTATQ